MNRDICERRKRAIFVVEVDLLLVDNYKSVFLFDCVILDNVR